MTDVNIPVTTGVGADTLVYNGAANNNYGALALFQLLGSAIKTLIRFDLSSIPSTSICTAASLKITSSLNNGSNTYSIYKIADANGDWVEGTKTGATAGTGEPCWNKKAYNTVDWAGAAGLATAGTDYIDTVLGTVISAITKDTVLEIPLNAAGLAVIQDWFGDANNNGLLITCTGPSTYTFHSGESTTEAYRPVLTITYTDPAIDLTAKDFDLSAVTFDAPTLSAAPDSIDLTAKNLTLSAVTFDAPTLTATIVTPAERTYIIDAESREFVIPAECREFYIDPDMRGVKVDIDSETKYRNEIIYLPLTGKDLTLAHVTFDAPEITNGYAVFGNAGVAGATVAIGAESVTSGVDGSYSIDGFVTGDNGTLTITKAGYEFYPQRKYVASMSESVEQDFTAIQMTGTYYVRPDGNDTTGNGSTGTPWATIKKAITTVPIDGKVYIKIGAGTYVESPYLDFNRVFTGIVIIEPESGLQDVTISCAGTQSYCVNIRNADNIRFRNLIFVSGGSNNGTVVSNGVSHYIDFINCKLEDSVAGTLSILDFAGSGDHYIVDGCEFISSGECAACVGFYAANTKSLSNIIITNCITPEDTGTTETYTFSAYAVVGGTIDNIEISNCTINNTTNSMCIRLNDDNLVSGAITNAKVLDCTVTGDNHVVFVGHEVNGAVVLGCTVNTQSVLGICVKEATNVVVSDCVVNGLASGGGLLAKGATNTHFHNNTVNVSSGIGMRNTINPTTGNKCSNCDFSNNTIVCSGDAQIMEMPADAEDGGGNVVDRNIYTPGGTKKYGRVRADTDVQTFVELITAWAGYGDGTNDSHSVEV